MSMEKEYVLITGSSSGIGEQVAITLSKNYNVIVNGRNIERLHQVIEKCSKGKHLIWRYDLSEVDSIESSIQQLIKEKAISIAFFVHCAGFMRTVPLKLLSKSIFEESFNVNIVSAALLMKNLVSKKFNNRALKSAVFVSSNISNFGAKAFSVYSSAKSGLDGLMRSLAVELAPHIRVNSVLPGGVRTRMTEQIYEDEELIQRMALSYPLGMGDVTEISDAIEFLLSEKARWITGQQLTVDGGRTINVTG